MIRARLQVKLVMVSKGPFVDGKFEDVDVDLATSEDPVLFAKVFDAMVREQIDMEERAEEQDR